MGTMNMADKIKQSNLDSAILFMQQEHAETLKCLHEEIGNLQKRCSELNFQVAMANTSLSQEDEYRNKCQVLQQELSTEHRKVETLKLEVAQKEERIHILEQTINLWDRKIHNLKETHRQTVQDLQTELNKKSDTVAVLTSKLHQLHQQANRCGKATNNTQDSQDSRGSSASSSTELSPRIRTSAGSVSRCYRRHGSNDHDLSSKYIPVRPLRPPPKIQSGRRHLVKPRTPENIPDPTPFLSRSEEELHLPKKERTVLPPINQDVAHAVLSAQRTQQFAYGKKGEQDVNALCLTSPEVETLAVSSVTQKEHCLRHPQDYKSTD